MSDVRLDRVSSDLNARRRHLLCATAALTFGVWPWAGKAYANKASAPKRIVVLNWELTETLLALGVTPIGVPLPDWYRETIAVPPLAAGVADVGLLYQPNFDVLLSLAPDLLIVTPAHASLQMPLRRIAPTLTLGAYMNAPRPFASLSAETLTMASAIGVPDRGRALITATNDSLDATAARLRITSAVRARGTRSRTVVVADVVDERHLRVYVAGSLFDEVLKRLGVSNAANPAGAPAARWAAGAMGSATVPLQRLLDVAHADVLLVGPLRPDVRTALTESPLWRALPAARERRVSLLPVIAPTGGLVSMQRFAASVTDALAAIDAGSGGLG
jgi:ferric hydroxamate transport system substrate-binding protein